MDTLPEISLGTAALIIFVVCAGYMIIRGLVRTFVNTAMLTFSAWVGFLVWQQAPAISIKLNLGTSQLVTTGLPLIAFAVTFLLLRKIIRFFRAPVPGSVRETAPKSSGQFFFRLIITIIPTAVLCLTAATFIHHIGSVAEIRDSVKSSSSQPSTPGLPQRLKDSISAAIPRVLMDWLDPLTTPPRIELAKMIAASPGESVEPMINPETGRPYPRAIIVDDPALTDLAKERNFSTLLRHPLLSEALDDPRVRQALGL